MSVQGRAIASYLAYRARKRRGANVKQIAAALRMHRANSVRPALKELQGLNLIEKKGATYTMPPIPEGLYFPRRNTWESDWTKRYAFWFVRIPEAKSKVTLIQAVMLGLIESRSKGKRVTTSYAYLAKCCGITKAQARYNYKRLETLKLIEGPADKGAVFVTKALPLNADTSQYFRPEPPKKPVMPVEVITHKYKVRWQARTFERLTSGDYHLTANQAHRVVDWMDSEILTLNSLDYLEQEAKRIRVQSLDEGTGTGPAEDYHRLFWAIIINCVGGKCKWSKENIDKMRAFR